jgi:uncharacterized membrane protein YccC
MRSGCLSLVFRVGLASIAAILIVVGAALFFSFVVLTLGPPVEAASVFKVIAGVVAGYAFFLVGRSVWRDLRERRQSAESAKESEDRDSTGDARH